MNPCLSHDTYKDCIPCQDCPPAPNAINLPPCADGEKCEEIMDADCVVYNGPNLPTLGILDNDRLATILIKLHQVLNHGIAWTTMKSYTASALTAVPFVIDYLGMGPLFQSTPGATSMGTTIDVGNSTGIVSGMIVEVIAGTGQFADDTRALYISSDTAFVVDKQPLVDLSGSNTVVRGIGETHIQYQANVLQGYPQTFNAFIGSPVIVSGQGTLV